MKVTDKIPDINSYYSLFESTGWASAKRTKEEIYKSLKNSWYFAAVYDDNRLIGSGRVISDGILHAFIVDLIISPDYQHKGIGSVILKKLVNQIREKGISDIQLFCAKEKENFYLKNGFVARPKNAPGMQYEIKNNI